MSIQQNHLPPASPLLQSPSKMLGPPLGAPLLHHTWPSPPDSVVLCQKHVSLVHGATEGSRLLPWWLRGTSMCHHPHGHRSLLRLQWRDLLLVRREATAEFPFPWLGRPWWCHTAVLGQPQHRGCSGTRCSAQKGNLQPSPVRARARGFSAGFLSLPLPLILSSRFLEMKQTQAPAFCVALVGGDGPSPSFPCGCSGDFCLWMAPSHMAAPSLADPTGWDWAMGIPVVLRAASQQWAAASGCAGALCASVSSLQ